MLKQFSRLNNLSLEFGRFVHHLLRRASFAGVLLTLVLVGLLFLAAAWALGLLFLENLETPAREVGFASAINWSINLIFFFPTAATVTVLAVQSFDDAVVRSARKSMLLGEDGRVLEASAALDAWTRQVASTFRILPIFLVLIIGQSLGEWWWQSGRPLLADDRAPAEILEDEQDEIEEIDWSVAPLVHSVRDDAPVEAARLVAGFSLACFAMQAVISATFILLVLLAGSFATWLSSRTRAQRGVEGWLVPDPQSDDPRRGFEVFQTSMTHMLVAGTCFLFALWSSRLWNVYLHHSDAVTFLRFVTEDLTTDVVEKLIAGFDVGAFLSLLAEVRFADFSSIAGLFVLLPGAAIIAVLPAFALRRYADAARTNVVECPARDWPLAMERSIALARLTPATMDLWPLRYTNQVALLGGVLTAVASYVVYRLALGLVLWTVGTILVAFVRTLQSRTTDSAGSMQIGPRSVAPPADRSPSSTSTTISDGGEPAGPPSTPAGEDASKPRKSRLSDCADDTDRPSPTATAPTKHE